MYSNDLYNEKLIQEDYQPEVKAYYFRTWNSYDMDFHAHDRVEIMYIISGECEIHIRDYATEKICFKKGDFILINAGIPHKLMVSGSSYCKMMNIEFIFIRKANFLPSLREFAQNVEELQQLLTFREPFLILKDYEDLFQLLKSLVIELNSFDVGIQSISASLLIYEILLKTSIAAVQRRNGSAFENYVNKAKGFMDMHYDQKLTLKDISDSCNLNEDYLNRIFKRETGTTIMDYLNTVRIEKAKMLLKNTNIPIIDISAYVGISSRQYFNQVFKRLTGQSPREFRKSLSIEQFH